MLCNAFNPILMTDTHTDYIPVSKENLKHKLQAAQNNSSLFRPILLLSHSYNASWKNKSALSFWNEG